MTSVGLLGGLGPESTIDSPVALAAGLLLAVAR